MTIDRIREFHMASPFSKFTLHLTDGRSFPVKHPEFMMVFPGGRTIIVATEGDSFQVIDLLMISSIESRVSKGNGRRNGKRKR